MNFNVKDSAKNRVHIKKMHKKLSKYFIKNFFQIAYYVILISILIFAIALRFSADLIYAELGNFYYHHNDVKKAQMFYEKSFAHGNKDYKTREIYVNSIINSPLTIESQEKLVNIAEGNIQDRASGKAKSFLYDLMREIHAKYPANYINQASYNQKIVHWSNIPITYSFKNDKIAPKEFITEIENAFNTWEKESKHRILFNRVSDDNSNIVIEFQKGLKEKIDYEKKYVVAYTSPIIIGNKLERMEIKFNIQTPDGEIFTPNQIYNTALHEIFHALGFMGHSSAKENIMFMAKNNELRKLDLRAELTEADLSTLELLYKTKPDITNEGNLKSDYVPYLVLGDNENKNISKRREAKNYIYNAPTLPNGYIDLAESLVAEQNYTEAIKKLEKALYLANTDDTKYVIYYNLAVCYYYITNYGMSEEYIKNAKAIRNNDELHYLLAEIYTKEKKYDNAKNEYLYLISRDTENVDHIVNLANIYIKQKQYFNARKLLKNFIKNNPKQKNNKKITQYGILII